MSYKCKKCNGKNVEVKTFYNINEGTVSGIDNRIEDVDTWCIDCEDHTGIEYKED